MNEKDEVSGDIFFTFIVQLEIFWNLIKRQNTENKSGVFRSTTISHSDIFILWNRS